MAKFIKRSIEVEAHQWFQNCDHPDDKCEVISWNDNEIFLSEGKVVRYYRHPKIDGDHVCTNCGSTMHEHGWIDTLEGGHVVCVGDWIITGINGEKYPCKPDIFEQTYRPKSFIYEYWMELCILFVFVVAVLFFKYG